MSERANISDLDSIRQFRAALVKFTETANTGVTDSDGEIVSKISWLDSEQTPYWIAQNRKWTEAVSKAIDAVRQKRVFKDSFGRPQSTVDEEKHLRNCRLKLEEAEAKLAATRRAVTQLQREHLLYRGGVQRLMTMLASDMPGAIAMLDRVVAQIEAYAASGPTLVTSESAQSTAETGGSPADGNMKRAAEPHEEPERPTPQVQTDPLNPGS
ncbi:MAG TPA: hypothetical protein VF624_18975 [Tepidisphaeraceae bacterium]|jgi:hypothetical protein